MMHNFFKTILPVMVFMTLLFGSAPLAQAEQLSEPGEFEAFFDDYLGSEMTKNHVAGAVVSVVKDDRILFSKGYGYADTDQQKPVNPDQTVFILGSLSKLFTWTAVMQLVEQGKLDINADVNNYLDFEIPHTHGRAVTLNHIMSHSAGFEENKYEQMTSTPEEVQPLGEWLKKHLPEQIYAPGQFSAYGNYGAALAGYIVQRVSGMNYDDYVEQKILQPLEMSHTTARQPVPEGLEPHMSHGYVFLNDTFYAQPNMFVGANVAPAASFRGSAGDISRFMMAHLNEGRYEEAAILKPETARLMQSQSFSHDPRVNGMAHGFWEMDMNGQTIIGHAGSHFIFSSYMMLFPEQKLGVFISVNSRGGAAFIGGQNYIKTQKAFVNHFFPQTRSAEKPSGNFNREYRFSGSYHMTMGRVNTTPEKLAGMMMAIDIKKDGNDLIVPSLNNARFVQVDPLVFQQTDEDNLLVFKTDAGGKINQVYLASSPQTAFVKNAWYEAPPFNLGLIAVCVILFISFLITGIIHLIRKRPGIRTILSFSGSARMTAALVSVFSPIVLIGAIMSVMNIYGLYIGQLPLWPMISVLSLVIGVLTLAMTCFTVTAWCKTLWNRTYQIYYTIVTAGAIAFVWFMFFWNIFGRMF